MGNSQSLLQKTDFPERIDIVKANMLFIPKASFSQKALNHLKRLASFKNRNFTDTRPCDCQPTGFQGSFPALMKLRIICVCREDVKMI